MGRHRALLIGTSEYEMRGVSPLPFVPGDLARLGSVLKDRGFDEVQVLAGREGGKQVSANYLNGRVVGFLRRARPGDTLLILLSGHGVHAKGRDYLVPEDIDEDTHPFESGCVAIDWREHLDDTPAGQVVFLIDACREGIEPRSMGVASVKQWSRQKAGAALRRKVAYVYACSPAQLALFVRPHDVPAEPVAGADPGETFSLFSRSVSDVVTAHPDGTALTLGAFGEAVQERVTELHRAYRKGGPPQTLRVVTDIPADGLLLLPPAASPSSAPRAARSRAPAVDGDTASDGGSAMAVASVGTAPPDRPRGGGRRRPRARVALTVLPALGVLAAVAWPLLHQGGDGRDDGAGGDRTGAVTSSAPGTPGPSTSGPGAASASRTPTPSGGSASSTGKKAATDDGAETGGPDGSLLPSCAGKAVSLTLRSAANSYAPDEDPTLEITVRNSGGVDCSVDLGPGKTVVTITAAGEDGAGYSSADCPDGDGSLLVLVRAGGSATGTLEWDRRFGSPGCGASAGARAAPGTYLAEAKAPGLPKATTSFVLTLDQGPV